MIIEKRVNFFSIVEWVWRILKTSKIFLFWPARLPRGYRAREGTSAEAREAALNIRAGSRNCCTFRMCNP